MPRLKTRSPRMFRNRNTAIVCIGGQTVRLGPWGSEVAQEAYDRLISEWFANGRRMPVPTAKGDEPTVTEIAVAYFRFATERYGRNAGSIRSGLRLMRERYGSEPAQTFGPKRLRVVRDAMIRKGWARSTVNERVRWIVAMFKWAASHELCSERIHRRLRTVPGLRRGEGGRETEKVRPVPRSSVRRVRRQLPRPVRALIDLQLLTGARPSELLGLTATAFDRSGDVWTYTPTDHKTAHHDKEHTIYFGPRAQRVLRLFMRPGRSLDMPLFSPREAHREAKRKGAKGSRRPRQKPTPTRTDRTMGHSYTRDSYRRAIHRACDKAFPPPAEARGDERKAWRKAHRWGPHRLRHNAATHLRRQFGLDVASVVLGHSSLAITHTYAELNDKKAREVIAMVG